MALVSTLQFEVGPYQYPAGNWSFLGGLLKGYNQ